jgi:hypothetical protein
VLEGARMAVVIGGAMLVAGVIVGFYGFRLFPFVLTLAGFVAGFAVGAALYSAITGGSVFSVFSSVAGLVEAGVVGVLFATLAHRYYAWAMIALVALAGLLVSAFWLTRSGYPDLALPVGLAIALASAGLAALLNLPHLLIVALTAVLGALLMVAGVLVLSGQVSISRGSLATSLRDSAVWVLAWVAIAAGAAFVQWREPTARLGRP